MPSKTNIKANAPLPYKFGTNRAGVWEIRWTEPGKDGGRSASRTWSTGTTSRSEAGLQAEEFWRAQTTIEVMSISPTVSKCCDTYLTSSELGRNISCAQRFALTPIMRELGNVPVAAMGPDDVNDYLKARLAAKIKSGTIRRELGALIAALNWAVENKLIHKLDLPSIKMPPPSKPREVYLSKIQEKDFWNRALNEVVSVSLPNKETEVHLSRLARYVAVSLATAARAQAVLDLTWLNVNYDEGMIHFDIVGRDTTNKRRVTVPIADRLLPILQRADVERQRRGEPDSFPVCGQGSIRSSWETFLNKTPYKHITRHDMRRTWASLTVQAGVPIYEVAKVLGDDVATVEKYYGHLAPGHLKSAINAV